MRMGDNNEDRNKCTLLPENDDRTEVSENVLKTVIFFYSYCLSVKCYSPVVLRKLNDFISFIDVRKLKRNHRKSQRGVQSDITREGKGTYR